MKRIGLWYTVYVCIKCKTLLDNDEVYHNQATCPYCANTVEGTVTKFIKITVRDIKHYAWYQLFNRVITREGADEVSKDWLNNHKHQQ